MREEYSERKKTKKERKESEQTDSTTDEYKEQFFNEELRKNYNAWKSWQKGKNQKKRKLQIFQQTVKMMMNLL